MRSACVTSASTTVVPLHVGSIGSFADVLAVVERLDDVVARRLGAQAELLHLLDELALRVARRRLGLLLFHVGAEERRPTSPSCQRRKVLLLLEAVGIDRAIARRFTTTSPLATNALAGHLDAETFVLSSTAASDSVAMKRRATRL